MSDSHRPDDRHVEPLYAAVEPEREKRDGPGLGVRLALVPVVALALVWLVVKQAY